MRFRQRQGHSNFKTPKKFLPVIPLEKIKIEADPKDKTQFVSFDLKVRAGGNAGTPNYKKFIRTFEEGTPQGWMDVLSGLREIWAQNSVTGATDRAATVAAILKGDSFTAFETALDDARINPDDDAVLVAMTIAHVETALQAVAEIVFPFRALEIQKQWMTRHFKKPYNLSSKKTAAGISRLNNYLPNFPKATAASKYSDSELVEILDVALPDSWRKTMDLKGFIPADKDFNALVGQMELIERNETPMKQPREEESDDDKKEKKVKFAKFERKTKKNGRNNIPGKDRPSKYECSECGPNPNHTTERCWVLKRKEREAKEAPYSRRTFRKEVNAMARRAGKNDGLKIFESAVKREQAKLAKRASRPSKKATKKSRGRKVESDSSSDESMHNMEARIPRKKIYKKLAKKPAKRNVRYNSMAQVVEIEDTDDDSTDEMEIESSDDDSSTNEASAEERAFLKAIAKEEQKANKESSDNSE